MSQQTDFPDDLNGFAGVRLSGPGGTTAFVAQQGAQVLSWRDSGGKERLYLSPQAEGMKRGDPVNRIYPSIRAGMPVCFPQFSGRGLIMKHGFARGMSWQRKTASEGGAFLLSDDDLTRQHWPHAFSAELTATLSEDALTVVLEIVNRDHSPWPFTCALHTYLAVGDVRNTRIDGLKGVTYQDATAENVEVVQQEDMASIPGEVDRVYMCSPQEIMLLEDGRPSLSIRQSGFEDTVVWNPGPEKARALKDVPDEDWLRMLCIEAAQAARPVLLQPGQIWRGSQTLQVARN